MAGLTAEEKKKWEECFKKADKSGDGKLSIQEMVTLVRSLGWCKKKYPDSYVCDWFLEVDTDKSHSVDLNEFLTVCAKRPRAEINEANLRRTFKEFDKDGSGNISASELKQTLAKCKIEVSDAQVNEMIKSADTSGDGQINVEEFLAVFNKA